VLGLWRKLEQYNDAAASRAPVKGASVAEKRSLFDWVQPVFEDDDVPAR
jgi:hypothetical protein